MIPCPPPAAPAALMSNGAWLRFLQGHPGWHAPAKAVAAGALVGGLGFACGPSAAPPSLVAVPAQPVRQADLFAPGAYGLLPSNLAGGGTLAGLGTGLGLLGGGSGGTTAFTPLLNGSKEAPVLEVVSRGDLAGGPPHNIPEPAGAGVLWAGLVAFWAASFRFRAMEPRRDD